MKNVLPYFALFLLTILLYGCQPPVYPNKEGVGDIQEIKGSPTDYANMIRMPISANSRDTVNVAKMEFMEKTFTFGTVQEGDTVRHVFPFKNTGKVALLITNAESTCGCTVPAYPKEPILPGESGEISVAFNTDGKRMEQSKPITLTANTYPGQTKLYLQGFVTPNE